MLLLATGFATDAPTVGNPRQQSTMSKILHKAAMCVGSSCTPKQVRPIVQTHADITNQMALHGIHMPKKTASGGYPAAPARRPVPTTHSTTTATSASLHTARPSTSGAGPSTSRPASKKPPVTVATPGTLKIHDNPKPASQAKTTTKPDVGKGKGKEVVLKSPSPSSSASSSTHGSPSHHHRRRRMATRAEWTGEYRRRMLTD